MQASKQYFQLKIKYMNKKKKLIINIIERMKIKKMKEKKRRKSFEVLVRKNNNKLRNKMEQKTKEEVSFALFIHIYFC